MISSGTESLAYEWDGRGCSSAVSVGGLVALMRDLGDDIRVFIMGDC